MMDFLRRLAPPRDTDVTRAVAALPSRFASEGPLRAAIGQVRPVRPDGHRAPLSFDVPSTIGAGDVFAAGPHPVAGVPPFHAEPRVFNTGSMRGERGSRTLLIHAQEEVPEADGADFRVVQNRRGVDSARARPAVPEPQGIAAADSRGLLAPPIQVGIASPLSEATLAQRTLQSREDGHVVHVTIGRIDVVATTAPAPPGRRRPAPRQATTTLAEYLRGNGSRR
jgi:hypothetical protein